MLWWTLQKLKSSDPQVRIEAARALAAAAQDLNEPLQLAAPTLPRVHSSA
jgi:hypothetical protein